MVKVDQEGIINDIFSLAGGAGSLANFILALAPASSFCNNICFATISGSIYVINEKSKIDFATLNLQYYEIEVQKRTGIIFEREISRDGNRVTFNNKWKYWENFNYINKYRDFDGIIDKEAAYRGEVCTTISD